MSKKNKIKINDVNMESDYLEKLTATRTEYEKQEKKMKRKLKISSYISAGCLVLIPVFTFWNYWDGGAVIILTAVISFAEFYVKFNKFEEKLNLVNIAITGLNNEYYNYYYDCKEYENVNSEKKFTNFVTNTTNLIKETELKLNNNYNTEEAIKKIDYKPRG